MFPTQHQLDESIVMLKGRLMEILQTGPCSRMLSAVIMLTAQYNKLINVIMTI
jgi:hypothetical protein